jgi:iron complex outermembrane receptor protein
MILLHDEGDFMATRQRSIRSILLSGVAAAGVLSAPPARSQTTADAGAAPEQVLVTGSLIHGTTAVGVPVTSVGSVEFVQTGSLTVSDLLRTIPSVVVQGSTSITNSGASISRGSGVDIHGLNSPTSPRTLMMFDGMRYPPQAHGTSMVDPSIVPQLAVDHVDVLADGASATYGSDAIAGVINVVLKRGYDGAITQMRYGRAEGGDDKWQASQLWGTTWDGGDVTVTYEFYKEAQLPATERIKLLSYDYTPWGLDNRTPVNSSVPAILSTGKPNVTTGTGCTNCYSVPKGQNGIGLTWASLLANRGVLNEISPYTYSGATAGEQRNGLTTTFDQRITPEIQFFLEGFYSNRRAQLNYPSTVSPANSASFTVTVPTINPYYPTGAPSGLNVSYNISAELTPTLSSNQISQRYSGGLDLNLPMEWHGKLTYSVSEDKGQDNVTNLTNINNLNAALGNTIAAVAASAVSPGTPAYTKPAAIPYLNVFCDPTAFTCNSDSTLQFIAGYRDYIHDYILHDYNANFDGPLLTLPGGEVKAAIGTDYTQHSFSFVTNASYNTISTAVPSSVATYQSRDVWAVFGQLNVPIVGEGNAVPLVRRLEVEGSYRYDHYSDFGSTKNPKVSVDWTPVDGLVLRGSWGTSFRAPAFSDLSATSVQIHGINLPGGATSNNLPACVTVGGTPVPGSAAAILNPTCSPALQYQGGISIRGGAQGSAFLRPGGAPLNPETARNLSLGLDFNPEYLKGFRATLTYFNLHITNELQGLDETTGAGLNDAGLAFTYILPSDPNFASYVNTLIRSPLSQLNPSVAPNITFIIDGGVRNVGSLRVRGLDFATSYDWELGDFGVWNAGISGTYFLDKTTTPFPGAPATNIYNVGGQAQDIRMKSRAQLGWSNDDGFSATLFMNYQSHFYNLQALPPASFLAKFPNYSNREPAFVTFDLSLGYNTGTAPANDYLKNIDIHLVGTNIANKLPPFAYQVATNGGNPATFLIGLSPIGRALTLVVTKAW